MKNWDEGLPLRAASSQEVERAKTEFQPKLLPSDEVPLSLSLCTFAYIQPDYCHDRHLFL